MNNAALVLVLAIAAPARADEVTGIVVENGAAVGSSVVRVVGENFIVTTRSDASGRFRVRDLPSGSYRVEVERGTAEPLPPPIILDRDVIRCCACAAFQAPARSHPLGGREPEAPPVAPPKKASRGKVDTHSTTRGIVITAPGRNR